MCVVVEWCAETLCAFFFFIIGGSYSGLGLPPLGTVDHKLSAFRNPDGSPSKSYIFLRRVRQPKSLPPESSLCCRTSKGGMSKSYGLLWTRINNILTSVHF